MTDENTPVENETAEPRQVDAVVALAETMAIIMAGLLEVIPPYPVQEGDIFTPQKLNRAQQMLGMGMHQLHTLLHAMGSTVVSGPPASTQPEPTPSSGIILPGQG